MSATPQIPLSDIRMDGGTQPRSTVYFIRRITGGAIKIGWSLNVRERLAQLQTGHDVPLKIIGLLDGGRNLERHIHETFAAYRLAGEWFEPTPDLLALAAGASGAVAHHSAAVRNAGFNVLPAYVVSGRAVATGALTHAELSTLVADRKERIKKLAADANRLDEMLSFAGPIWAANPKLSFTNIATLLQASSAAAE